MRRIAAPMIGGIFTSFLMELLVYPIISEIWKGRQLRKLNTWTVVPGGVAIERAKLTQDK
jgi:hypothetical protein